MIIVYTRSKNIIIVLSIIISKKEANTWKEEKLGKTKYKMAGRNAKFNFECELVIGKN